MMPGETIFSGASETCPDCGIKPELQVCQSPAGFYLGTYCDCGPYSRETNYFKTRKEAERALFGILNDTDLSSLRG